MQRRRGLKGHGRGPSAGGSDVETGDDDDDDGVGGANRNTADHNNDTGET
jgi:hypothetical protein